MKTIWKSIKYLGSCFVMLLLGMQLHAQDTAKHTQDTLQLNLSQALEIALNENPTIKIADMEITRIDYLKKESWGGMLPTISASGQYIYNPLRVEMDNFIDPTADKIKMGTKNSFNLGISANLPLFAMGLYRNIQLSNIEMQNALEGIRASKINLTTEVKNAYFNILLSQKALEVLQESYNNALETFTNIKSRYDQGMTSEYDKITAEVRVRNVLPNLAEAKQLIDLAMLNLRVLLSLPMNTNLKLQTDFTEFEKEIEQFEPNVNYSLQNNTDLKKLDIQISKLEKQRQLVSTTMMPTLAAFGSFSSQVPGQTMASMFAPVPPGEKFSDLFNTPFSNTFSAGLSLNIPLFSGGVNLMKVKQLKIANSEMQLQREYTEENLNMALQNQINNMLKAKLQLESNKEAMNLAKKGFQISTVRYETGQGTLLELNTSEIALTQASLNYYQAIHSYLMAVNELEKIQGNGY